MSIHTIGDSHSYFGFSGVISNHLGPILCYSFGNEKLNRCDIRNYGIKDGYTLIFCFGEIDCRCHIKKNITNQKTYENIIDNIILNYIEAIKLNISVSCLNLKNVCIYNVVPPIEKQGKIENPEYPFLGTDEERKSYVLYFNKILKDKCLENNFIFFDIYNNYINENGYLKNELSDGNCHILNGIHINNFIKNHL